MMSRANARKAIVHQHHQQLRGILPRPTRRDYLEVSISPASPGPEPNNPRAKLSFHAAVDSGVTVNRFSQDLQLIDMELPGTALGLAVSAAFGIAEFIMIAVASRYIAAILPLLLLSFYLIQHFYLRTSRQIRLLDIELKAPLYTQLITTLDGLVTIRAFGWQGDFERRNLALLDESQRPSYLLYCIQRWLTLVVDMMIAAIALVLIVVTTTLREQIGPGYMGIALSNILSFSGTVKAALTSWVMLEIAISAVARIRAFSQTTELEGGSAKDQEGPGDREWPAQGGIELRGVSASYSLVLAISRRVLKLT